jgi:quercetin dioxygenase-like cupin family protein
MKKDSLGVSVYKAKPVFADKRGQIFDFIEELVSHVGMISFKKGAVRGNHYHKKSVQYTYVISGKIAITLSDIHGKNVQHYTVRPGSVTVIPARIVHTYEALTNAVILDLTTKTRKLDGYEKDTVRMNLS